MFSASGIGADHGGEEFRGELGERFEDNGCAFADGVTEEEFAGVDESDDITGEGFVHCFALLSEELVSAFDADASSGAGVEDFHVAFEESGADADEGDAVAMSGVKVGLDFEDEAGEFGSSGGDEAGFGAAISGGRAIFEEAAEELFDAVVGEGAAEEDRSDFSVEEALLVPRCAGFGEQFDFFLGLGDNAVRHGIGGDFGERLDAGGDAVDVIAGFEDAGVAGIELDDAAEVEAGPERPVDGDGDDAEFGFDIFEDFEGGFSGAVNFVDERDDGDFAEPADVEEFFCLGFDAVGEVEDHDGAVGGDECAVGIFAEVLVAGGIEEIDLHAVKFEGKHGGADGDSALAFEFHPV